ncbi:MAG: T9SS type A sorting domain-containing protein [Saprospiraceae bacterium]|nr:T9SS type A sorting domain-containing protein [Saprospiraceae bacterium]
MKHLLIPLIVLIAWKSLSGQSMERQVVATAGGYAQTPAGALHWTAGEMAISPRSAAVYYWGEGFHQVWVAPALSSDDPGGAAATSCAVFPNPATDVLFLTTEMTLQAQLFDLGGRAVSELTRVEGQAEFNLADLPAGLYLLRLLDENGRLVGAAKVQHLH